MSVIYKISCLDESVKECYIGSTIDFKKRMTHHKSDCHNENGRHYNVPLYQFIRENQGWGAWKMTIIDSLTTTDKKEIEKCERKYIEEQEFSLNKFIPTRTSKEYWQEYHLHNKEKINKYQKQYQQAHKEEIAEKKKQYREANREKLNEKNRQYHQEHKEKKKQYYQDHKEELAENKKQYYQANREKINKYNLEKIQCERCGAFSTRCNLTRHQKTKKCINTTTTTK